MDATAPTATRFSSGRKALQSLGVQLLTATAVLMVAALILMSVTLSNLTNSREEAEATTDTMLEITTIETRMMENDAAINGFALSGGPFYQLRMRNNFREIQMVLGKLRRSLQNEPDQLAKFKTIVTLVRERDGLNAYLSHHREEIGRSATARSVRTVTDRIRATLWDILKFERDKRLANHTRMIADAHQSFWISVGIVFLTFIFGAGSLVLSSAAKGK
jgi:CHASE3 domain sensor protein